MKRRFWIAFYAFNLLLYAAGTLLFAAIGIEALVRHMGLEWKGLFVISGGLIMTRFAYELLRRELRTPEQTTQSLPTLR